MWALVKSNSVDTVYGGPVAATIGDIKYPKTIFTLWSESQRKAIGIYDIVRKDQPNNCFYDTGTSSYSYNAGTDKVSESFDITEKNLAQLKKTHTKSVKTNSCSLILPYDWLAARYTWDNTKAIPSVVKTYVAAVRSNCVTICSAIDGCSDLAAFKVVYAKIYDDDGEYNVAWPDNSDIKYSYER